MKNRIIIRIQNLIRTHFTGKDMFGPDIEFS
jgi:hypothetical protein